MNITKGITLQGQTTVEGAGTANPVTNDLTIVLDDVPRGRKFLRDGRQPGSIPVVPHDRHHVRRRELKYCGFNRNWRDPAFTAPGDTANNSTRVDHCHFKPWYISRALWPHGWTNTLIDHIVVDHDHGIGGDGAQILVEHQNWAGSNQDYGNGSWADLFYYGTEKFVFIEDSTFNYVRSSNVRGFIDAARLELFWAVSDH